MPQDHPILKFLPELQALAEGRTDPAAWLTWWTDNAAELETLAKPGWFLVLKPRGSQLFDRLVASHQGACKILSALEIPHTPSDRYSLAWREEFSRFQAAESTRIAERAKSFRPIIDSIARHFPKFGKLLQKKSHEIEELDPPVSETELAEIESSLGLRLPETYKSFLRCTAGLWIRQLDFRSHNLFIHHSPPNVKLPTHGLLCFAEYSLEADGDQLLFNPTHPNHLADPPVYYYAHEASPPQVRELAPTFSAWLESLPRSPMFK